MTNKINRSLRSKAVSRAVVAILAVLVVVLVAGFVFDWWGAVGDWLSGTGGGYWKGVPKTADGCVTTYQNLEGSGPIGSTCFKSTKLVPGYFNCEGQICYVEQLTSALWLRTDEVTVTP